MVFTEPFKRFGHAVYEFEKSTQFSFSHGVAHVTFKKKEIIENWGSMEVEISHGWYTPQQLQNLVEIGAISPSEKLHVTMRVEKISPNVSLAELPTIAPKLRAEAPKLENVY